MKFEPFVVMYEPKQVNKLEVKVEGKEIPMCKDCKWSFIENIVMPIPVKQEQTMCRFCGLINRYVDDNWFCADGVRK